jgi:hypothetical protein
MAQLEFFFIGPLEDSEHGIPNLESQIAQLPALFLQAVALAYKRNDEDEDPQEWRIENPEQRTAVATAAHRVLDQISKIPGSDEAGRIDARALAAWLAEVRRLCREHGRADIGDILLGQLLAKAPEGENGLWPCEAVCNAMEAIASPEIARGFHTGVRNTRGVHWRGEDGEPERDLAAKYHAMAERLHFDYPYVGGVLASIATSYEREAGWHDSDGQVERRLRY